MTRLRLAVAMVIVLSTITGCGTHTWVTEAPNQAVPAPQPENAQVIFLQPSAYFSAAVTLLSEWTDAGEVQIAAIGSRNKVVHNTSPGQKLFISNNGAGVHVVAANLVEGRRYFVLVQPHDLASRKNEGFELVPINANEQTTPDSELHAWMESTVAVEFSTAAKPSIRIFQDGFDETREKGLLAWRAKNPAERAALTLLEGYGVPVNP